LKLVRTKYQCKYTTHCTNMNSSVQAPIRKRFQLVFDVETTGLLPKPNRCLSISDYPYITQVSFVIYDLVDCKIVQTFDSYIDIESHVVISDEVSALTGITRELCREKGRPIVNVLLDLYDAYHTCDGIVGHNLDFDVKMILIEMERHLEEILDRNKQCCHLFQPLYEELRGLERYCTLRKGTSLCNIVIEPAAAAVSEQTHEQTSDEEKTSKYAPRKKWPRLAELYVALFGGEVPEGLHNALVDVKACLRCYLKMRHNSSVLVF
jgi:DNA polymerase III epsilon subunit-like protein